jgi:hypothetical protein
MKRTIKLLYTRDYEIELYKVAGSYIVIAIDRVEDENGHGIYDSLIEALENFNSCQTKLEALYDKDTGVIAF